MRFCSLFLLCCLSVAMAQDGTKAVDQTTASQPAATQAETLIGAWRLISIETVRSSGEVIYPFYGKHPEGLLIYDRSGWMSVQIVSDPKPSVPSASSREKVFASPQREKAAAFDGYYAYLGTWTLDPEGKNVTHHIRQSLSPGEPGEDAVRRLTIAGDRLTLAAKAHEMGEDHERRLVWERVKSAH